ncbi:MAG: peptidoglycan-binding protein [Acidobacteriia bacterium]|nr:peptidoglycan-binding protein [Terriglobia bacterium]
MQSGLSIRSWTCAALCGVLCLAVPASAASPDTSTQTPASSTPAHSASVKRSKPKPSTVKRSSSGKPSRGKSRGKRKRGQQAIDSPRAREIQEALIRDHYMTGEPSGKWDAATQDALKKYQAAQGWQTKTVPDSRALIKLGLGPSKDGLLNPESAMTAEPLGSDANGETKAKTSDSVNGSSNPPDQDKPQR